MNDVYVPLSEVMKVLVGLCSECRHKVQANLAACSMKPASTDKTLGDIINEVSSATGVPKGVLIGRNNSIAAVNARRKIAGLARELGYSYPRIGAALNKHHTTIIHLLRNHAENKETKVGPEVSAARSLDSAT